jgi:hypothetical protein
MLFEFELDRLPQMHDAGFFPGGITAACRWYLNCGMRSWRPRRAMHGSTRQRWRGRRPKSSSRLDRSHNQSGLQDHETPIRRNESSSDRTASHRVRSCEIAVGGERSASGMREAVSYEARRGRPASNATR